MIINENRSLVIDFGMSLLVPYASSECDGNDVTDVARMNGCRRLMTPQGQLGKRRYMSPEIWRNQDDFDGFSIDIWTAGMILFCISTLLLRTTLISLINQIFFSIFRPWCCLCQYAVAPN